MADHDASDFADRYDVSRETLDRLERYAGLIVKWNRSINLVAESTEADLWSRHFVDSAEAFKIAEIHTGSWLDMGSGGGFPGAVVAIVAAEHAPDLSVTCIEADIRKAAFLRTLSSAIGVPFGVLSRRIEEVPAHKANVVSARALSPLTRLLEHAELHLADNGIAVFHKGESWQEEVDKALATWDFSVDIHGSPTNPGSVLLTIGDLKRV